MPPRAKVEVPIQEEKKVPKKRELPAININVELQI